MPDKRDKRTNARTTALKPTQIQLKSTAFRVNDISSTGMGLILEDDGPAFAVGERLEGIPIPLQRGTVPVNGVVTHLSITDAGTICGIRFEFSGDEFDAVIQFRKERMRDPRT